MPLVLIKSDAKAREKPCLRCGYSLRKILDARNCPECGLSVWVSLNQNDSLEWSRPDWLRMISLGAAIMAGAQVLALLMSPALFVPRGGEKDWVLAWGLGVYLLMLHAGMILLGMPERRYPDKLKPHRWFLVGAGVVGCLLGMFVFLNAARGRSVMQRWGMVWLVEMMLLVGAAATLLYIRQLAHRLGKNRLSKVLGWMLLIPLLKFAQAFPIWGIYLGWQFMGIVQALPLLYVPISLGILIYLGMGFRRAAREAEVNWANAMIQ